MNNVFLDASSIKEVHRDVVAKQNIQQNNIRFEFPNGFSELRLIEECRALNALDVTDPDNFDLMYDITMQMLNGKPVFIYYIDEKGKKNEVARFVVTSRYMNLRGVDLIDAYPVVVNWLVEFIAGYLGKKYPRSLSDIREQESERKERMMKNPKEEVKITTSFKRA